MLFDALVLEHLFFSVKKYSIGPGPKDQGPIRILHLTDLHFRHHLYPHHLKLIKRIRKLKPDLILISGDSIDQSGSLPPFEKFLRTLPASIPKLAIPGNHDYVASPDIDQLAEVMQACNGQLLLNETKIMEVRGRKLAFTGFDDLIQGTPDVEEAFTNSPTCEDHLGLIHSPKHFGKIMHEIEALNNKRPPNEKISIKYFFAGHNHGGQVSLGHYAPVLPPQSGNYVEGWYSTEEAPHMYLSRGFGTSRLPIRFMARAEISLFEYYPS